MKKITAIILSIAMIFTLAACDSSDYKKAVSLMNSEEYSDAKDILETIIDYKDSRALIDECNYEIAMGLFKKEKYQEVIDLLEDAEDHEDSVKLVKSAKYEIALGLIEEQKYERAEKLLGEVGNYKDAEKLRADCHGAIIPEEFNQALIDMIDSFNTGLKMEIKPKDSYYNVYMNSSLVGILEYNHIDENGSAQDEGIINHATLTVSATSRDLETKFKVWQILSPFMMCAIDDSLDNDTAAAMKISDTYLTKAASNQKNYDFTNNDYYYRIGATIIGSNVFMTFSASSAPLK